MKKELKFIVIALCIPLATFAQNENTEQQKTAASIDDAAFTFTEAQIGDDDNTLNTISKADVHRRGERQHPRRQICRFPSC